MIVDSVELVGELVSDLENRRCSVVVFCYWGKPVAEAADSSLAAATKQRQ
jgi:hypothetical protein